jgi:hypothetical protein
VPASVEDGSGVALGSFVASVLMKKSYQKAARDLKKLGLINYDLRQSLSSGQKARITKLQQEFGHAIKHPELFHKARVGQETAKQLKAAGFKVTPKNVAIIPLHEYKSASIQKNRIVFDNGAGMKETTYLVDHKNWFQQLQSLMGTPLPRNKMVTVRIGDRNPFKRARFGSYAELYYYLDNDFHPNDEGEDKESLFPLMSIVEIQRPPKKAKALRTKEGYKIDPETGEINKRNVYTKKASDKYAAKKATSKGKRRN